jgi:hypothetical protein
MKRVALFLLVFAAGCGGKPAPEAPEAKSPTVGGPAPTTAGKPSEDEAAASIKEYFTDPGMGWSNVEVKELSAPVAAPADAGDLWAYSVTMTCDNVVGDKMLNKNWLILIGRENGKPRVKDYYQSLERVAGSPLGKEWFAKSGLPEPATME